MSRRKPDRLEGAREVALKDRAPAQHRQGRRGRRGGRGPATPDILYHATTVRRVRRVRSRGVLEVRGGRPVFLSRHEGQAWQAAWRMGDEPAVLVVDAFRARRAGCRFRRNEMGLWQVDRVPIEHVLNLQAGYGEQVSAGGLPVWFGPDGPRVLLIRVRRRNGSTWEVAKGKLEPAETPAAAAVREIREEIGFPLRLQVVRPLGWVRYGFYTPEGDPRLKTLHMFLLRTPERVTDFEPRQREGIREVAWFDPREAERLVPHRSLRPLMRRVARLLADPAAVAAMRAGPFADEAPGGEE